MKRTTSKSIYSTENELLSKLLVRAREKSQLTQTQLAEKLSRSQSWVAKVESGQRLLDVVQFVRYVRALGQRPGAFLDRLEKDVYSSK